MHVGRMPRAARESCVLGIHVWTRPRCPLRSAADILDVRQVSSAARFATALFLQMVVDASAFSPPGCHGMRQRSVVPAAQSVQLRTRRARIVCQGGDLGKEFEEERRTREEMDRIFKKATDDLKSTSQAQLDIMAQEADELMQQREEEWERLKDKMSASLTSKVDSLAEDFLKKTGSSADSDDDDEDFAAQKFLGPQVCAVIGPDGKLRDALKARLEAQAGLSLVSCDRLLNTRGMTIEAADTLVFLGHEDPLDRGAVERLILRAADAQGSSLRFVLVVSSLGTRRSSEFPWSMQNGAEAVHICAPGAMYMYIYIHMYIYIYTHTYMRAYIHTSIYIYIYICRSMQNAFSGVLDKKRDIELGVEQLSKEEGFGSALSESRPACHWVYYSSNNDNSMHAPGMTDDGAAPTGVEREATAMEYIHIWLGPMDG